MSRKFPYFYDPNEKAIKYTGLTPIGSPYEEPAFADPKETEVYEPADAVQYPAPRPPMVGPQPDVPPLPAPLPPLVGFRTGGTRVVANPNFDEDDPSLFSIRIGNEIYKIVGGGAVGEREYIFAVSDLAVATAGDFTITDGVVEQYAGSKYLLIGVNAPFRSIGEVYFNDAILNDDGDRLDQSGAFQSLTGSSVTVSGTDYNVWISRHALRQPNNVIITVE